MNQSLLSENELFSFTKPSLVLYVEDAYNTEINTFIQSNFKQIVDTFNSKDIDLCYLPYLLQNKDFKAVINYNRPYLLGSFDKNALTDIYSIIKSKLTEPLEGSGLVLATNFSSNSDFDFGYPLKGNESLIEQFDKFAKAIYETYNDEFLLHKFRTPQFKRSLPKVETEIEFLLEDTKIPYEGICFQIIHENDADSDFDYETYRLADEIRTRIQQLKESGSLSLIGDILEEIQGATKKLSSLFITNDYRIFLKDYGMKEVEMSPLPKCVFILFLRHPEGILFKHLSDYHDELLSIYRNLTVHEDIDRAIDSIRAMTDPLNNSINEKCSRIRAAFLEIIADNLAQNYYVTGKRGEPKKIILDRTLVEFQ